MKILVFVRLIITFSYCQSYKEKRTFPPDFIFGSATAAYQVEGAWNEDGKSESIWDYITHKNPNFVTDMSNADIAGDSYHNYKRDVEIMRELGLQAYRFSLSWTRILPSGFAYDVNPAGIAYYNMLIDEMLKYNITPMVTIYHLDLPQKLQNLGGFANPLIADWFEDYARVAFKNFGDRVKHWITFNEPVFCNHAYGADRQAPAVNSTAMGSYWCAKNLILAHANAYHAYNNDFKPTQGGQCGITLGINWYEPLTDSPEDKLATELKTQGDWAQFAEPLFSEKGGFPKELSERIAAKSAEQGFSKSRLPDFTDEEKNWARGAVDFLGINQYTGYLVSATEYRMPAVVPSFDDDVNVGLYTPDEWVKSPSDWLVKCPRSMYNVLMDIKRRYNNPVIYITENGWSSTPESGLVDDDRITFYRDALEDVLDAIDHGVDVKGFMAWSMIDNFEWTNGYTERFGLYHVDFEDPARTRTPRKSAFVYKHIVKNRYIDHEFEPDTMTMTIDEGH